MMGKKVRQTDRYQTDRQTDSPTDRQAGRGRRERETPEEEFHVFLNFLCLGGCWFTTIVKDLRHTKEMFL